MMNQMLQDFIKKQQKKMETPEKPNKVKAKTILRSIGGLQGKEELSLAMIMEKKPSRKKVLEYLKMKINDWCIPPDSD
jgi:hypothetical protein